MNTTRVVDADQYIYSGGIAGDTFVTSDGYQEVYGGGVVFGTFLTSGSQYVYSGGMAAGTVVNMGGYQEIDGYGIASGTEVNNGGRQYVSEAGSAIGTVVNSGGTEIVYSYYDDYATMDGSGGSDFGAAYTVLNRGGTIDLRSVQYVSGGTATLDPTTDVLTITEGGETYTLQLAGNYAGERFMLSPGSYGYVSADAVLTTQGSGYGTDITIAPPPYSDFLGNGTSDILFRDSTNGQLGAFLMNNGVATWGSIGPSSLSNDVAGIGTSAAPTPPASCSTIPPAGWSPNTQ